MILVEVQIPADRVGEIVVWTVWRSDVEVAKERGLETEGLMEPLMLGEALGMMSEDDDEWW